MKDFINEWANDCNVKVLDWRYYGDSELDYGWIDIEGESVFTNIINHFSTLADRRNWGYRIKEIEFNSYRITLWFE